MKNKWISAIFISIVTTVLVVLVVATIQRIEPELSPKVLKTVETIVVGSANDFSLTVEEAAEDSIKTDKGWSGVRCNFVQVNVGFFHECKKVSNLFENGVSIHKYDYTAGTDQKIPF